MMARGSRAEGAAAEMMAGPRSGAVRRILRWSGSRSYSARGTDWGVERPPGPSGWVERRNEVAGRSGLPQGARVGATESSAFTIASPTPLAEAGFWPVTSLPLTATIGWNFGALAMIAPCSASLL